MANAAHVPPPSATVGPAAPRWMRAWRWCVGAWRCVRGCSRWESVVQLGLVLWIARVPAALTAFGCLLLWQAPQAQDLFIEFSVRRSWPDSFAAAFDLGFLGDLGSSIAHMAIFVVVLIAFWAMPTHYAARQLLDTDERLHDLIEAQPDGQKQCLTCMVRAVPRLLGSLTFVAVLFGLLRSYFNVPLLEETGISRSAEFSLLILAVLVVVGFAVFCVYMVKRDADLPILRSIKRFNSKLAPFWNVVSPGLRGPTDEEADRDLGRLLFGVVFGVFVLVLLLGADFAASLFPRAMALPFILGGWMPFLSYVGAVGRAVRAPLILGLFIVVAVVTLGVGDNHMVRRINASETAGRPVDTSPMPLEAAVNLWVTENCRAPAAGQEKICPRPIIIASAGGASRAAFFMSSVVGRLMFDAPNHDLSRNDIRNRLFAISSVSGGSLGAVMVTAALDAKADASTYPCGNTSVPLWYGASVGNWQDCFEALTSGDFLTPVFFGFAFNDMLPFVASDRAAVLENSWRDRFDEIVTRADASPNPKCKGLECPFLSLRPRAGHWIPLLVLNGTSEATGGRIVTTLLDSAFTPSAPCPTKPGQRGRCGLFTEADHFHELLAAEHDPALDSWKGLIGRRFLKWYLKGATLDDVRLSTAAHNSARFPFVSPPGTVRSNVYQQVIDRVVDGGYFENYGVISANELALAIRAVDPKLSPLVIVISNDPDDLLDPRYDWDPVPEGSASPALARARKASALRQFAQYQAQRSKTRARVSGSEPLTDFAATITAFKNAWPAHGTLAVEDFRTWLHQTNLNCPVQLVHVRVWPQTLATGELSSRAVSMSWWLSTPVQRLLHQQLEDDKNQNRNMPRLTAVWSAISGDGGCTAPQAQNSSR